MSTATLGRRLPSLSQAAPLIDDETTASVAANPCKVLTASSRYRNDPYRGSVLGHLGHLASSDDGTDAKPIPTPPSEPVDKLPATAPRRPHSLRSLPLPSLHVAQPPATPAAPTAVPKPRSQISSSQPDPKPRAVQPPVKPAPAVEASPENSQERGRGASKIALIQFKRTMMSAIYDSNEFPDLSVGETIVVEGDRGEHIATVARVSVRKSKSTPTMILRYATAADLQQHSLVREDEAIALNACRAHAQRLGLDEVMSIVDVEFQLDFQKLTVFFEARNPSSFVDFRSLQRALYQHFRCRIWIVDC